jgi:hypothetical protein
LVGGGATNNQTNVLNSLLVYGDLIMEDISSKLISFVCDGVLMFIGVHSGVTTQIYKRIASLMLLQCVAHWINMGFQTH